MKTSSDGSTSKKTPVSRAVFFVFAEKLIYFPFLYRY
jgi:hypothetical protein